MAPGRARQLSAQTGHGGGAAHTSRQKASPPNPCPGGEVPTRALPVLGEHQSVSPQPAALLALVGSGKTSSSFFKMKTPLVAPAHAAAQGQHSPPSKSRLLDSPGCSRSAPRDTQSGGWCEGAAAGAGARCRPTPAPPGMSELPLCRCLRKRRAPRRDTALCQSPRSSPPSEQEMAAGPRGMLCHVSVLVFCP